LNSIFDLSVLFHKFDRTNFQEYINLFIGICSQHKYLCEDECVDENFPCRGICQSPKKIACKGKCIIREKTWDCNGECQDIGEPCNGVCHKVDGIACKGRCISKKHIQDCNGECQYFDEPCNGVCLHPDYNFCEERCNSKGPKRDCKGKCKHVSEPCNGVCLQSDYNFCEESCKSKVPNRDCKGTCKHISEPCNGLCLYPHYIFCEGKCISRNLKWECNGKCQYLDIPCNEVCPTLGNVTHIQESYFKCPQNEKCFLLSEMCDPSLHEKYEYITCFGKNSLSDKLCNWFPNSNSTFSCPLLKEPLCKQSRQCIKRYDICNGVIDCFDRSDESLCPENLDKVVDFSIFEDCETGKSGKGFKCGSVCISDFTWCQTIDTKVIAERMSLNISECPVLFNTLNNERLCQNLTFWSKRACPRKYMRAVDNYPGKCIPKIDNEESNKKYNLTDSSYKKCLNNNSFIKEELWCDGYPQCPNGSDEDPSDCGSCPRTFGFPKDYKHATFSCKHKYTGRPICAVPCDGKDDLCFDDIDEQCSSASVQSTLLFGTVLVILSIIVGELYVFFVKKAYLKKKDISQLIMLKENFFWRTLESCLESHLSYKKTFYGFEKIHLNEKYAFECIILSHTLGLMDEAKAQDMAQLFYNLECKYHSGNIESVHVCIQRNFTTNDNTKHLFELIRQPPIKSKFLKNLGSKILNIQKTKYVAGVCFLLLVSVKLFAYHADVYKDIYVIVEYSKLLPRENLNLNSFGFQVFIILIVSVTLPMIVNLFTLYQSNEWSNLQSKMFHFGILILSPIVPALAIYISSKLNFVTQRIKTFHQNNQEINSKNSSESIKTLFENNDLKQRSLTILSDLRSNENATEHFIQSLVLITLIALKFTKSGTVSGFQVLLAGNTDFFLLVLSAVWSVFSIISGFVQRKIVQKNNYMPFTGILIQLSYATLAMTCRIFAYVIFFAPAIGLFNMLGHWKMGINAFGRYSIYDVTDDGTLVDAKDIWKQINNYEELTVYQLNVYYIVFLFIILFHFLVVAAVKIKCSKEFKSRKDYLKKMLHILHQGNKSCTFFAENILKM